MNNETYIRYKDILENAIDNNLLEQDNFDINNFQSEVCDIEKKVAETIEVNEIMGKRGEVSTSKLRFIRQMRTYLHAWLIFLVQKTLNLYTHTLAFSLS